jgi:hypothetical protein
MHLTEWTPRAGIGPMAKQCSVINQFAVRLGRDKMAASSTFHRLALRQLEQLGLNS